MARFQLRWLGHVTRMPQERLTRLVRLDTPMGKGSRGRNKTKYRDYISNLAWSRLGVEPSEQSEVADKREMFGYLLAIPPKTAATTTQSECEI